MSDLVLYVVIGTRYPFDNDVKVFSTKQKAIDFCKYYNKRFDGDSGDFHCIHAIRLDADEKEIPSGLNPYAVYTDQKGHYCVATATYNNIKENVRVYNGYGFHLLNPEDACGGDSFLVLKDAGEILEIFVLAASVAEAISKAKEVEACL